MKKVTNKIKNLPFIMRFSPEQIGILSRWLMLQHMGIDLVPLDQTCTEEAKKAAWYLYVKHTIFVDIALGKDGIPRITKIHIPEHMYDKDVKVIKEGE